MRSKRRAPQFWPRIGPIAPDSANRPPKATGTSRSMMAMPAIAPSPKRARMPAKKALGHRRRDVGQDGRSGDGVHRPGIGEDIVEAREGDEVVHADGAVQADHGEEEARHDGGDGGAVGAEPEAEDEQRVERRPSPPRRTG